jgi:large subunit ribosomal protein L14
MIQRTTILNVIDNSGAKEVYCIKVRNGYKKRYGEIGDELVVSIRDIRYKKKKILKIKKGDVCTALLTRTKFAIKNYALESISFLENAVVLLNNKKKLIGTRIFGILPKIFRKTRFSRVLSLCSGLR